MKILIKFCLLKKEKIDKKNAKEFPFWSCVLDTSIEEEIVNYKHLNRENKYKIKDFDSLLLRMEYLEYSESAIENLTDKHQKRPEYFVALDKTFLTGSPYNNSSSLVVTYYQDTFEFVKQLNVFCDFNSDYKLNLLQHNVIELINDMIGIDIIKNESIAGALSIYSKLPAFEVDGNYNSEKGERYVTISTIEDLSDYQNLNAQIEITDNDKILHNTLQNLLPDFKYILPDNLEDFSQLHISVLGKRKGETIVSKIFEEKFHLLRSYNIEMSIGGSHSKTVQNRYLNWKTDKIAIYDHIENISNKPNDFFDIELAYKSLVFGKDKKFLESEYFGNTPEGRKAFLDWIRKKLHGAKDVKIIDAYFDNYALNDFSSCCDTRFQLTIITIDPKRRKKTKEYVTNTKNLKKEIHNVFPDCKIYYAPKFHDRYLYIDDDNGKKLYSFSNSWNGTVNHNSIFIQELPFTTALIIYDEEINTYIIDKYLQKPSKPVAPRKLIKSNNKKYTKKYITTLFNMLKNINNDINKIISISSKLFFAYSYGKDKKDFVRQKISECLENMEEQKIKNIIDNTIESLLTRQKNLFDTESKYIDGKSFSWFDTPCKCMERLSNINMWYERRANNLSLDYGLTELLYVCFSIYPIYTIKSLLQHEEKICIKKIHQKNADTIFRYHVSEYIIQLFLTEYYPFKGLISEQTWKFIEKTDSSYIRLFFALSIINEILFSENNNILFDDLIGMFTRLQLRQDELTIVLGRALNNIILRNKSPTKLQNEYYDSILEYIAKNIDGQNIINFSFIAFIEPFEIKVKKFIAFMEILEQYDKKKEAENIEKLFVLYALQTNKKLQNIVRTLFGIERKTMEDYFYKEGNDDKEPSDIDIKKFIPTLSYLGGIFANNLETNQDISEFEKIIFSLSADMKIIFNTKFPSKLNMLYYDLLFLLYTVCYLKKDNSGSQKILDFTSWYIPVCINCFPNDFYGLGYKIVGLYTEIISEEKKKSLLNSLIYLPIKALVASVIKEQSTQTIEIYQQYIKKYDIDGYDKLISEENFLTIGISLCIRCTDECNSNIKTKILGCIMLINDKIKIAIPEEEIHIFDYGIEYVKTLSKETKKTFIDSMKEKFFPIQARSLMEE